MCGESRKTRRGRAIEMLSIGIGKPNGAQRAVALRFHQFRNDRQHFGQLRSGQDQIQKVENGFAREEARFVLILGGRLRCCVHIQYARPTATAAGHKNATNGRGIPAKAGNSPLARDSSPHSLWLPSSTWDESTFRLHPRMVNASGNQASECVTEPRPKGSVNATPPTSPALFGSAKPDYGCGSVFRAFLHAFHFLSP